MASSFDFSTHHFAVQVHPSKGAPHDIADEESQRVIEALQPDCRLEGWFLPAQNTTVTGMRVLLGGKAVVVKRKQIRPDILRRYPEHPEALLSGFKADFQLGTGLNELKLQFKDAGKKWHDIGTWQVRLSKLWRLKNLWSQHQTADSYEQWLTDYETPSAASLDHLREEARQMKDPPLISVLLPVSGGGTDVQRTLDSVHAQAYPFWELCIAIEESVDQEKTSLIEKAAWDDQRIKICQSEGPGTCALAEALSLATGGHVAFLHESDALAPHALHCFASQIMGEPEVELLYSDEDEMDSEGKHHVPCFKGAWNHELLLHSNCVGNLLGFRTSTLRGLGGVRPLPGADLEWDILLRAASRIPRAHIRHLPRVLCHRHGRPAENSAPYEAGKRAVLKHLTETKAGATLQDHPDGGWHISWPLPSPAPLVSIIVPTRNRADLLRVAMESLFAKTKQPEFEIIVVDHASDEAESLAYFKDLAEEHGNVRFIHADGPFNWSRLNNLGAQEAHGDILVFLNNDVEIIQEEWLQELAANAWRQDVGAVGACLLYPDGTIQHAGIVLGMTGLAGHVFRTLAPEAETIGGRADLPREVVAVTGACLAVRRSVFDETGGFDELNLPVSYNDVDFCLKLRSRGLRNIYTPFSRLIHHESVSRGENERSSDRKAQASEEALVVLKLWPAEFQADAFYSPNLSLDHEIPELGNPPPRLLSTPGENDPPS